MTHRVVPPDAPERVVLVAAAGPFATNGGPTWSDARMLEELRALARSVGAEVVAELVQRRDRADPRTLIGRGKAEELRDAVAATEADLVLFDNDLTPAQGKALEDLIKVRVLDRTELILDIFADRARTREAKLQVELAQLQYLLPRLKRMWTHLSRIRGGIGLRGPGETQLEVDRRTIRTRINVLREELAQVEERRSLQRKGRRGTWNVALVGYTNVGKSTIMNRLAGERLEAEDRLFATLDATTRRVRVGGDEEILLTDTVGFIRDLPHHLVASFRATLEEVVEADLLLHVADVSDPDHEDQMRVVAEVLADLGAATTPTLLVFNKLDLVPSAERAGTRARTLAEHENAVVASAVEARGLDALAEAVAGFVRARRRHVVVTLPFAESRTLAQLHEQGAVVAERYTDVAVEVELRASPDVVARLASRGVPIREAG